MIKNYLKVAFRNILKKKYYSFLNLLGLSIGITSAVLIIIYVQDELNYDTFHPDAEHKYVVGLEGKFGNQEIQGIYTPPILASTALEEVPGVKNTTRTNSTGDMVFRYENRIFTEKKAYWADPNFFEFFGYELIEGDSELVLDAPNKAVLTESTAKKYFGDENPIGKTLIVGNGRESYEVTGVTKDSPHNSHFRFDILLSFSSVEFSRSTQWLSNSINTYFEIYPDADIDQVDASFDDLVVKYAGPQMEQFMGATIEQMREQGNKYGYFSIPILDLHLNASTVENNFEPAGDITYVYIFSVIGIFLIVIACVNFMNLSTASAAGRAKEVGLRKTLGAERKSMIAQFLFETLFHVVLAALFSMILIYLVLPWFNILAGKELTLQIFTEFWFIATMFLLILTVGAIAGSYPALYLTAFEPVDVLKGKIRRAAKSGGFRQTLVVGQFFISIGLITCTILVNQQLQYMQNRNLGIDKEHSLVLTNTSRLGNNREAFKQELLNDSRIISASYSNYTVPGTNNVTVFKRPDRDFDYIMNLYYADHEQNEALGFEMTEGRFFSRDFPTDTSAIVINEAAVKELGFEDPVGKDILYSGNNRTYRVVGVIEDFNFETLKNEIMPLAIMLIDVNAGNANEMIVRFRSEDPRQAVQLVEANWDKYSAGEPVDYTFLDDDFAKLFEQERRLGDVFTAFTVIAIIIACLGLLGLSAYMAEQRTKEIGVRKVMGASVPSILWLLSVEFLKLVGLSFILAVPVSWYFMQNWLQDFSYRIDINPVIFGMTALLTLVIVFITISWQTLKAAHMNPVESIQSE